MDFKAAIFDIDGTLADSNDVWDRIDINFLVKHRLPVPDDYIQRISDMDFAEAAVYTIKRFGLKHTADELTAEWYDMAACEYAHHISLKPHAKEYLLFLKKQGVKLGIATALPRVLYEPALKNNGIYNLFNSFLSTEDVRCNKDCAEFYLLAAQELGVAPEDCIAFDDALFSIKAIVAAGMTACGVYDRYWECDKAAIRKLSKRYIFDFTEMMQ